MKNIIVVLMLLLTACTSESSEKMVHECSSIYNQDGETIVENAYFKVLPDDKILSIKERKNIGAADNAAFYSISPVDPKAESDSWEIDVQARELNFTKTLLLAETSTENSDASFEGYSLNTGELVLEYTYDKLEVKFGDENKGRFLGFYSNKGVESSFIKANMSKKAFGLISFASQDHLIDVVRIEAADDFWLDVLDISNPVMELIPIKENAIQLNAGKMLYFTGHDGDKDDGVDFDLKIMFYTTDTFKPVELILEVRDNRLVVPSDFSHSVFQLESL